ncbi:transcriptional regulator [Alkalinema sp. FACHB-956]|uniref:P-II family nitrogen regulator n=1 Tax=Alkalinema sp. FACHB-956 TaxID=2692768 RepID=UPI00168207E9|nr:transcriptional regulator [Alkalinema sp. FACHB-956]MBD2326964.1 transcriptional regulator [Alkalinema sp. FACHB-956]
MTTPEIKQGTKPVKRIEIVVPAVELRKILKVLDRIGVGYSIFRNVMGRGDCGQSVDDFDLGTDLANDYILTLCDRDQEEKIVEGIRPLLERYGGVCWTSDANWVIHTLSC